MKGLDLDLKALQTAGQIEFLDAIDALRAEGLGELTNLPQLIVCGDQSTGKSSVLEAISGIPFLRDENLSTRYATEVILRRNSTVSIKVSITPSTDRSGDEKQRLLGFKHDLATLKDFEDLFKTAQKAMGLEDEGQSFSKDVLRIEFSGPKQPQLTLVDLPGLFHVNLETEKTDHAGNTKDLVEIYMKSPRSIILAVVSATYDHVNQIVLQMASKLDPKGARTFGILTKPDWLVPGSKNEDVCLSLVRNQIVKFELGWHVIKNLDTAVVDKEDATSERRDKDERAYFRESNFKNVNSDILGIANLRERLSKTLFHQIKTELPKIVDEIQKQVEETKGEYFPLHFAFTTLDFVMRCFSYNASHPNHSACHSNVYEQRLNLHVLEAHRERLGKSRTSLDEKREYLTHISQSFQSICQKATRGDYEDPFFWDDEDNSKRLCARLMAQHREFASALVNEGCQWKMIDDDVKTRTERCKTGNDLIHDACELLKRNRGREVM